MSQSIETGREKLPPNSSIELGAKSNMQKLYIASGDRPAAFYALM
jgi:hypothetical protein